jgi:hypothetical protein
MTDGKIVNGLGKSETSDGTFVSSVMPFPNGIFTSRRARDIDKEPREEAIEAKLSSLTNAPKS